jgi:putative oxidoreductase
MKTVALAVLWVAIAAQVIWIGVWVHHHGSVHGVQYALFSTLGFAVLGITRGRYRWIATALRMFIGFAFFSAVLDRFGVYGAAGAPGVSWGNFKVFTIYTGMVNSFLPVAVIPALAVVETLIEAVLAVAMLIGAGLRVAVWASAALLFSFGTAMTVSLGLASQFAYAVFVFAAGCWVLATIDTTFLSVDALWNRWRQRSE